METKTKLGDPIGGWTSPEERLQHDIEELERGSGWRGALKAFLVIAMAVGVGATIYFMSDRTPPKVVKTTATGGIVLDVIEPAQGKLDVAPSRFRWESVIGHENYAFRLAAKGVPIPLVERVVRDNTVELTIVEASRLAKGTTYIWEVQGKSKDGTVLGTARGVFDL